MAEPTRATRGTAARSEGTEHEGGANTASGTEHEGGADAASGALIRVLVRALRGLGEAGEPERANRLAAQAWSATRHTDPAIAEKLNGTMHYLSRLPDPANTPHRGSTAAAHRQEGE